MEFINKLSFEKFRTILNMCGLFLIDDEKYFNDMQSESNKNELDCYYIRALDINRGCDENQSLNNKIIKEKYNRSLQELNICNNLIKNTYFSDNSVDIYSVSDYMLCRAFPLEIPGDVFPNKRDTELQDKFFSIMSKTFKNREYQNKYDKFVDSLISNANEISPEK